jgi:hypothetical protein
MPPRMPSLRVWLVSLHAGVRRRRGRATPSPRRPAGRLTIRIIAPLVPGLGRGQPLSPVPPGKVLVPGDHQDPFAAPALRRNRPFPGACRHEARPPVLNCGAREAHVSNDRVPETASRPPHSTPPPGRNRPEHEPVHRGSSLPWQCSRDRPDHGPRPGSTVRVRARSELRSISAMPSEHDAATMPQRSSSLRKWARLSSASVCMPA